MSIFKYTTTEGNVIHITLGGYENITIEEEGVWSETTQDECEEFFKKNDKEMESLLLNDPVPVNAEQKLQAVGLTVAELKSLLGLQE
jgi:hypothetical protein